MTCPSCGSETAESARFCASCGAALPAGQALEAAHAQHVPAARTSAAQAPRGRPACVHCGLPAQPIAYFSRGLNVAKAAALAIPFNAIGPLLFFLLRKDRFVCSACHHLLPGEAPVPMLAAFSPGAERALAAFPTAEAGVMTVGDDQREAALLQHKARRNRNRAIVFGAVGSMFGLMAVAAGLDHDSGAAFGLFIMGLPAGIGTAISAFKARTQRRLAAAKTRRARAAAVLEMARARQGRLNVTLVATELRMDLAEAEQLLDSMVDGRYVEMDVDDDGRVSYVFPDLTTRPG